MEWDKILPSAIGGASSLVGSIISNAYNAKQADKQREWSEEMWAKENAWNEEMWTKTNEYNSPENQIKRLRDAGLNPMYYGLDGSAASAVQSATPLGYERATMTPIDNPVTAGLNAAAQIAQISNVQANTAKTNNENLTETQRRENMQAELLTIKQELQNQLAEEGKTEAETKEIEKRIEWVDRLNQATIAEADSRTKLNNSTKNRIDTLLKGEKIMQSRTIEDFDKKWRNMDAEFEKISAETGIAKLDIENYALNHMQNGMMGSGVSLQNWIRQRKDDKKKRKEWEHTPVKEGNPIPTGHTGIR